MSLQKDIFNEFIKKLEATQLPTKLIDDLRKLWINGKLDSKEEILVILKEVYDSASRAFALTIPIVGSF
jgi:uncharacterized protein YydD (DUF2326 family)